ncbi:MAG: erythromycin esterase family protein, partial [Flavobacteriales bacterium]|nr:erythromycin esterase family protein [Flavobacteriales bacterium]
MKFYANLIFLFVCYLCLAQDFKEKAHILESVASLDILIAAASDKKLVLLGEASHGTHEYYAWRDLISRRLIEQHDFNFIAVEGDFASLYELNRYVKNKDGAANTAREVLLKLNRWPTWMWANEEVVALAEWLRKHNDKLPDNNKIGFYGMDVYDEWRSKTEVLNFLKIHNTNLFNLVKEQYSCFSPYIGDSWQYAKAVNFGRRSCSGATKNAVELIEKNKITFQDITEDDYLYLLQ